MAAAGTPVLRIDDLSVVELIGFLPESCYGRVTVGRTVVRARCGDVDLGEVVVTTRCPTIHSKLRTFEVKALVTDPPAGVVPGARVDLTVVLAKRTALGVPRESVVRRGGGRAVFTVVDGVARMRPVTIGLEMDGWIEVRGDGLTADARIVRMGQDRLNDGVPVTEVREETE
jgi:HlyD family secretion protein